MTEAGANEELFSLIIVSIFIFGLKLKNTILSNFIFEH